MHKLKRLLFILLLFQFCNSADNNSEFQTTSSNEFIWTGIRANFYEDDSLNSTRGYLFVPTMYFDFQYKNFGNDTVKIILSDNCSIYVEGKLSIEKNKYCLTGFSVADTVRIYPSQQKNFSYTLPYFKESLSNKPAQVMVDVLKNGSIFYTPDSTVYNLPKARKFKVEYREPDDMDIE